LYPCRANGEIIERRKIELECSKTILLHLLRSSKKSVCRMQKNTEVDDEFLIEYKTREQPSGNFDRFLTVVCFLFYFFKIRGSVFTKRTNKIFR